MARSSLTDFSPANNLRRDRPKARSPDLYPLSDPGAGEGVSLQSLPDAAAAHRDRARALPYRKTDQDLVPEPPHEVEKREQDSRPRGHQAGQGRGGGGRGRVRDRGRAEEERRKRERERNPALGTEPGNSSQIGREKKPI